MLKFNSLSANTSPKKSISMRIASTIGKVTLTSAALATGYGVVSGLEKGPDGREARLFTSPYSEMIAGFLAANPKMGWTTHPKAKYSRSPWGKLQNLPYESVPLVRKDAEGKIIDIAWPQSNNPKDNISLVAMLDENNIPVYFADVLAQIMYSEDQLSSSTLELIRKTFPEKVEELMGGFSKKPSQSAVRVKSGTWKDFPQEVQDEILISALNLKMQRASRDRAIRIGGDDGIQPEFIPLYQILAYNDIEKAKQDLKSGKISTKGEVGLAIAIAILQKTQGYIGEGEKRVGLSRDADGNLKAKISGDLYTKIVFPVVKNEGGYTDGEYVQAANQVQAGTIQIKKNENTISENAGKIESLREGIASLRTQYAVKAKEAGKLRTEIKKKEQQATKSKKQGKKGASQYTQLSRQIQTLKKQLQSLETGASGISQRIKVNTAEISQLSRISESLKSQEKELREDVSSAKEKKLNVEQSHYTISRNDLNLVNVELAKLNTLGAFWPTNIPRSLGMDEKRLYLGTYDQFMMNLDSVVNNWGSGKASLLTTIDGDAGNEKKPEDQKPNDTRVRANEMGIVNPNSRTSIYNGIIEKHIAQIVEMQSRVNNNEATVSQDIWNLIHTSFEHRYIAASVLNGYLSSIEGSNSSAKALRTNLFSAWENYSKGMSADGMDDIFRILSSPALLKKKLGLSEKEIQFFYKSWLMNRLGATGIILNESKILIPEVQKPGSRITNTSNTLFRADLGTLGGPNTQTSNNNSQTFKKGAVTMPGVLGFIKTDGKAG